MADDELPDDIVALLVSLDDREREVLRLRFGLDQGEPRTLDEVAEQLRATPADVKAVERRAMEKLKVLGCG